MEMTGEPMNGYIFNSVYPPNDMLPDESYELTPFTAFTILYRPVNSNDNWKYFYGSPQTRSILYFTTKEDAENAVNDLMGKHKDMDFTIDEKEFYQPRVIYNDDLR